ncbi:homolog of E.coli BolA 4 [Hibiscus trionum]|uniref:Homolog of E.coli BolA 4 n=1 Tax=Hibiscus trionum TaxID=183268 RepID=A0A9W7GT17_HIBTR|nr:homolog of E.coli BolA 4 [Hibiscus trionum]
MAKPILTTRPYIFSSTKTNLFFSHSNKCFIQNSTLFPSSNIISNGVVSKTRSGILGHRRFSIKATHVNEPGSFDSPLMQSMEKKIKDHLNAESVIVKDASGDGRHVW